METLNELANWIGFTNIKGLIMFIGFLTIISLLPLAFWYGNKQKH